MYAIKRILVVFLLVATSGVLSQQLGAFVAARYVATCETVSSACH